MGNFDKDKVGTWVSYIHLKNSINHEDIWVLVSLVFHTDIAKRDIEIQIQDNTILITSTTICVTFLYALMKALPNHMKLTWESH
jgi:hypothetical protein